MAKPRVPQNLPPESQQWVRDVERRLNELETQNQRLTRSVTQNAGQIGSINKSLAYGSPIVAVNMQTITTTGPDNYPIDLPVTASFNIDAPTSLIHVHLFTYALGSPAGSTNGYHYVEIAGSTLGKILPDDPGQGAMLDSSNPSVSVDDLYTEPVLITDYYVRVAIPKGETISVTGYTGHTVTRSTHEPYQVSGTSTLTCGTVLTIYPNVL